jgi:hypothetical protein
LKPWHFLCGSSQSWCGLSNWSACTPPTLVYPQPRSTANVRLDTGAESGDRAANGTAKCPEPLCPAPVLPGMGRHELSPGRTLLLRHSSYGLMRQSRQLSSPSALASFEESVQVATSPCCQLDLLDVILRIFPWLPGPLPRRSHRVHVPVVFPDVIGLPPRKDGLAFSRFIPRTRLFVDEFSRLQTFLYVQAPKFARLPDRSHRNGYAIGRPRLLHPGRTCFVASARTGHASRPNR